MPLDRIEQLLRDTMGLDAASVGRDVIEQAVSTRQRACGVKDAEAYWERARDSGGELQNLIEAVVVHETWFFRDEDAFAALVTFVRDVWLPAHPDGVLRLLSLPCSTGEEPYSMAMALLDGGFPANRLLIDAVDISAGALAQAERGVYRKSAFRGSDVSFRDRYFIPAADGHQILESARQPVHFGQGNVLAGAFMPGADSYDVIFCRNLLIYFDRPTQSRVVTRLAGLLAPDGLLFVGASESGVATGNGLASAKMPMAFAFRKAAAMPPRQTARATPAPSSLPAAHQPPPRSGIDDARQLADQGRFAEAARRCEEHLQTHGPVAEAFYLLGLVRDASGNHAEAAGYYRKALYLDPSHNHALAHLALLMEDQGKPTDAQILRNRIKRLDEHRQA